MPLRCVGLDHAPSFQRTGIRGCLGFGSEGEREELGDGFVADVEVRTPRYGPRKRGRRRPKIARAAQNRKPKQPLNLGPVILVVSGRPKLVSSNET